MVIVIAAERATAYIASAAAFDSEHTSAYAREEADGEMPASAWSAMAAAAEHLAGDVVHLFTSATTFTIDEHAGPDGQRCPWSQALVDASSPPWQHPGCPNRCPGSTATTSTAIG
ncbi:hypothetical protein GCM10009661_75090 [Catellatospora chokoriensis]|uniref:Uncharacterized protein n=2 Tax=Catellatospora chokoriensis TaxID=310353 RepID=A0A8J3KCT5_9ACTN|nr:hypothetical protein Cch02nite_82890 [Catellatospora chokoriensis]